MRRSLYWVWFAALQAGVSSASVEVRVDAEIPAGNIVCERIEGDQIFLHQELRDTAGWWFYWAFRVCGAEGRTLNFLFTNGEPVGTRGPAVSIDQGLTWRWLNKDSTTRGFTYAFAPAERDVWFAFGMVYTQRDWERFLQRFKGSPFLEQGQLAVTRKGRSVEKLRVGCIKHTPRDRVLLTARHHACEMMPNYVIEGLVEAVLTNDEKGTWLRENVEFLVIPFVDKDGAEDGDQGKNRAPRDHNRDYSGTSVHAETSALREQVPVWAEGRLSVALDLHCPEIRGGTMNVCFRWIARTQPCGLSNRCSASYWRRSNPEPWPTVRRMTCRKERYGARRSARRASSSASGRRLRCRVFGWLAASRYLMRPRTAPRLLHSQPDNSEQTWQPLCGST